MSGEEGENKEATPSYSPEGAATSPPEPLSPVSKDRTKSTLLSKRSSAGPGVALSAHPLRFPLDFTQFERIASTSTGEVFRVQHNQDGSEYGKSHVYLRSCPLVNELVAVKKICFPHFDESQESYKLLLHEAKTLAHLSHPNIVKYYNSWIELDEPAASGKAPEDTYQSFVLQMGSPLSTVRRTLSSIDEGSFSEGIDSSITAITFTEVRAFFKHRVTT